jgi:amidase
MGSAESNWRQKVANKREACWEAIPKEWRLSDELKSTFQYPLSENKNDFVGNETIRKSGILTEKELTITEDYTVSQLLAALSQGTLSALEVTLAFSKRAAIAQQLVWS